MEMRGVIYDFYRFLLIFNIISMAFQFHLTLASFHFGEHFGEQKKLNQVLLSLGSASTIYH